MKSIKILLVSGCVAVVSVVVFSSSIENNSLSSLKAKATIKCTQATNCDCRSASTGTIYTGYRGGTISGT